MDYDDILAPKSPDEVIPTSHLRQLLDDVDDELRSLRELGAFSPQVADEIRAAFLPNRITDTLTIEGYRVNPRVTRAILEGQSLSESDRYNEREVLNILAAHDFVTASASQDDPLATFHVTEIHRQVYWLIDDCAGHFRTRAVTITGADLRPPSSGLVPQLVDESLMALQNSTAHSIIQSAWIHWQVAAIHPFIDGNGRAARLCQDLVLLRHHYLPVGIPASRRTEYYDALTSADHGDLEPLIEIVANSELTTLGRTRQIAEAPSRRMDRIRALVRAAQDNVRRTEYLEYEVWRRRVELLVEEFRRWLEDVNSQGIDLYFRIKVFDPISFEVWNEIRRTGRSRNTWIFRVTTVVKGHAAFSVLFYARRHEWAWTIDQSEDERGVVGMFATGAPGPDFRFIFGRYDDPYLRLREIIYIEDEMRVFYRGDAPEVADVMGASGALAGEEFVTDRWASTGNMDLATVVEHFLADLLAKHGLI